MVTKDEELTLENLKNGAAIERFNDELQSVLQNIMDPNTAPKATRAITLKVTFKPDEDRNVVEAEILCSSKLAPPAPVRVKMFVGGHGRNVEAHEVATQQELPLPNKVVPMQQQKGDQG